MPEEWRGSDGWVSLMALYLAGSVIGSRGGRGLPALPSVLTNDPHNGMWRNLYPWEHVIVLQTVPGVVTVSVVLFGELRYDLPVATPLQPAGPRVWLCDYREKTPLTFASVHELARSSPWPGCRNPV